MMGVTYCFRKEDHVVIVMPYMEHQAIVVQRCSHHFLRSIFFNLCFNDNWSITLVSLAFWNLSGHHWLIEL